MFFIYNMHGDMIYLPQTVSLEEILAYNAVTLRTYNDNNMCDRACVYHKVISGVVWMCPICTLDHRTLQIHVDLKYSEKFIYLLWNAFGRGDMMYSNVQNGVKVDAVATSPWKYIQTDQDAFPLLWRCMRLSLGMLQ